MRIISWNIGGGFISTNDGETYDTENIDYFSDILHMLSPDFICIQEAHISNSFDQPNYIAQQLGLNVVSHAYDESHLKPGCHLAVTILSRHVLEEAAFFMLPNPRLKLVWNGKEVLSHDKGFLFARTRVNGREFHVASGHLFPLHRFGHDLSESKFLNIRESMEKLFFDETGEVLIGADMNCDNLSKVLPRTMQAYIDAPFVSTRPDGRITDHILYPRNWVCYQSQVVPTQADHFLCMADISFP